MLPDPKTVALLFAVLVAKFVGYAAAASAISYAYDRSDLSSRLVGGVRLLIGTIVDAIGLGMLWCVSRSGYQPPFALFWFCLAPVRLLEWWLLVWIFYDRSLERRDLGWKVAILGTAWSYALDVGLAIVLAVFGLTMLAVSGGGIGK